MRCIVVQINALGTTSWTVDRNCRLVAISSTNSPQVVVSMDPALTAADVTTVATNQIRYNLLGFSNATSRQLGISMPLQKGDVVYVAFSGQGSCFLHVE